MKMKEIMDSIVIKKSESAEEEEPEAVEEEEMTMTPLRVPRSTINTKTFEDQVLHAFNTLGMKRSYDIAKHLRRPRGSVYNAMRRLGLRPVDKTKRKSYNSLPEHKDKDKGSLLRRNIMAQSLKEKF